MIDFDSSSCNLEDESRGRFSLSVILKGLKNFSQVIIVITDLIEDNGDQNFGRRFCPSN